MAGSSPRRSFDAVLTMNRQQHDRTITEQTFSQQAVDLAHWLGWCTYHTWLSVRSLAGFPDFVLARAAW